MIDRAEEVRRIAEVRYEQAMQEVGEARHQLRSWRARNPNANSALFAVVGFFVGLIAASLA